MISFVKNSLKGISAVVGHARGPAHWLNSASPPAGSILLVMGVLSPFAAASAASVAAVLSTKGGTSSHGVIMLRQKRIPCVCSVVGLEEVVEGEILEVDAFSGVINRCALDIS